MYQPRKEWPTGSRWEPKPKFEVCRLLKEIRKKEFQKVDLIFIASLFNKKKAYLGFNKFNILTKLTKKRIIALGGINKKNLKKLNLLNIYGYSGITLFGSKKNGPTKIEGPLNF